MKLLVVALAALVVAVSGSADDCGPLQRLKVKHQWYEAYGHGKDRITLGLKIWNNFFHDHPEARALFARVHGDDTFSPEFEAHAQRIFGGIDNCISMLDDRETLAAELAHLKGQHDERGIKSEHYDHLITTLLEVLPDYLGPALDFAAWNDCMHVIVNGIRG